MTGRQPRALSSALELLEAVARAGPGVSAAELAAATGIPRATTYRLLNLLVAQEHLVRLPDLSGFALGARVQGLVEAAAPVRVVTAARDELARLRAGVRAGVHLLVLRAGAARVADADPDVPPGPHLDREQAVLTVLGGRDEGLGRGNVLAVAVREPAGGLVGVLVVTSTSALGVETHAERLHAAAKVLGPLLA
nr:helix-turn-helix domain-containing protein [Kineococcus aurantiacus]